MDNFDKLFQDKLNEVTENDFEFKESSWERFNEQMKNEQVEKRFVPLVWLKNVMLRTAAIIFIIIK